LLSDLATVSAQMAWYSQQPWGAAEPVGQVVDQGQEAFVEGQCLSAASKCWGGWGWQAVGYMIESMAP
jgi:hypothetical protein